MVAVTSADNLCTNSLTSPTCVWTSAAAGADTIRCTADDTLGTIVIGAVATPCAPAAHTQVDSRWAYYEDVTVNSAYDVGEDIYIDTFPKAKFSSVTSNTYFGNFILKPLSASELGWYDLGNNPVLVLDEGASPIIWEQVLSSQFEQGSFENTITSNDRVYLAKDQNGNYYLNGIFTSSIYNYSGIGDFIQFRTTTELPASTKISAQVQVSDDNFSTIKDSITLELVNDTYTYDISSLSNAKSVRVKFDFQTEDTSITPELIHFEVWADLIEIEIAEDGSLAGSQASVNENLASINETFEEFVQKVKQALASLGLWIENEIA